MRTAQSSFVVELELADDRSVDGLEVEGRIEHVLSGNAVDFDSAAAMLAFIHRILASGKAPQPKAGACK